MKSDEEENKEGIVGGKEVEAHVSCSAEKRNLKVSRQIRNSSIGVSLTAGLVGSLCFFRNYTMLFLQLYCKILVMLSLLFVNLFSLVLADDAQSFVQKRQIGVLARAGALPQGKRSVEVLARNGELPHIGTRKEVDKEDAQDLLIEELERAESLSKLRAQALVEKLIEEGDFERFGSDKRSVAALARNGELPQKRLSLAMPRSGYLIRPPQETVQPTSDLLDPDDFLADGQSSMIPEYLDERSFRTFLSTSKRSLGSARNFLLDSGINSYNKKNLASLARDGGFASLRHPSIKQRRTDDAYELTEVHDDDKKNVGASASFDKREALRNCRDNVQTIEVVGKANSKRRKREQFAAESDCDEIFPEFRSEGNALEKRFLEGAEAPAPLQQHK